jgi:hypothetical protein
MEVRVGLWSSSRKSQSGAGEKQRGQTAQFISIFMVQAVVLFQWFPSWWGKVSVVISKGFSFFDVDAVFGITVWVVSGYNFRVTYGDAVSSEMVPICQTTWHHMPEDCNFLESNIFNLLLYLHIYFFFFIVSGVGLSPLYCGHFWPVVPAPDDRWGWLSSNWWNEDWQGKPAPAPRCPPQIPLDQAWDRTRAAAVGSQRLTAWAMNLTYTENLMQKLYLCVGWKDNWVYVVKYIRAGWLGGKRKRHSKA